MKNYALEDSAVSAVVKEVLKQKETMLLEQLQDLVSRNLLVIEETAPVLVRRDSITDFEPKFDLVQKITLKLRDQEYIEELEAKVVKLEQSLDTIRRAIND